jgi:hypothetical protein
MVLLVKVRVFKFEFLGLSWIFGAQGYGIRFWG